MAPRISLFTESQSGDQITLAEVTAPQEIEDFARGEPTRLTGRNDGDSAMRNLSVSLEGEGEAHVQLAADQSGEPGVWADIGGSILIAGDRVSPGDVFAFWARGIFGPDDAAGIRPFEFVFHATDIG